MLLLERFPVAPGQEVSFHDSFMDDRHGLAHGGIDIGCVPQNAAVVACVTALVQLEHSDHGGNMLRLNVTQRGVHYEILYTHLNDVVGMFPRIAQAGSVIGHVGRTGRTVVTHLHFQVRRLGTRNENPYTELLRLSRPVQGSARRVPHAQ
jgi:murein DD-endopeptidase MepM/ murein hydrolase activator NlpD